MSRPLFFSALFVTACGGRSKNEGTPREDTPDRCSDTADNDEDGRVDCDDQDCWKLDPCRPDAGPDGGTDGDTDTDSDTDSGSDSDTDTDTDSDTDTGTDTDTGPDPDCLEGETWHFEVIDAPSSAQAPAITVGSDGTVHVAYTEGIRRRERYATDASGAWTSEDLEDRDSAGNGAILVSMDGTIAIASSGNGGVRVATGSEGDWTVASADAAGSAFVSLVEDEDENLHVFYYTFANSLRHATDASGVWEWDEIATGGLGTTSAVVRPDGSILAVACDQTAALPTRAFTNESGDWVESTVDVGSTYSYCSLSQDADGNALLAMERHATDLRFGVDDGGGWVFDDVSIGALDLGGLVVDADGQARMTFIGPGDDQLTHAVQDAGGWATEIVDPAGGATLDLQTALALGPDGRTHVAYTTQGDWDLLYAKQCP